MQGPRQKRSKGSLKYIAGISLASILAYTAIAAVDNGNRARRADMHNESCMVYAKRGMLEEAADECRSAISIRDSAEYRNNLGAVYILKGDLDMAEEELRASLKLELGNEEAIRNMMTLGVDARYDF
jgi:Flp pilus assembly protein TadD